MTVRDSGLPSRPASTETAGVPFEVIEAPNGTCTVVEHGPSAAAIRQSTARAVDRAPHTREESWWDALKNDENLILYLSAAAVAVAIPTLYFTLRKKTETFNESAVVNAPAARVISFFTDLDKYFKTFSSSGVQYTVLDQTRIGNVTSFKLRHHLASGKEIITHGKRRYSRRESDGATLFEDDLPISGLKGKVSFAIKPSPENSNNAVVEMNWTSEGYSLAKWFSSKFSPEPLKERLAVIKRAAEADQREASATIATYSGL